MTPRPPSSALARLLALALASMTAAVGGCASTVTVPSTPDPSASDELWYATERSLLAIPAGGAAVYYCPPSEGPNQKVCKKAVIHTE